MIGHDKSYHNPLQSVFDLLEADLTMQTIRKSTNLLHHADHFELFGILKILSLSLITHRITIQNMRFWAIEIFL